MKTSSVQNFELNVIKLIEKSGAFDPFNGSLCRHSAIYAEK